METQPTLFPAPPKQTENTTHRVFRSIMHGIVNIAVPLLANRRHRRYDGKPHHLVFDSLLTLCIIALITMNIVLLFRVNAADVLDITLDVPASNASGTTIPLLVTVTNTSKETLRNVAVIMVYPSSFIPTSAEPNAADDARTEWDIPELTGHKHATIAVYGRLTGMNNDVALFHASVHYTTRGRAKTVDAFGRVQLSTAGIVTTMAANATTVSGKPFTTTITVHNTTSDTLENVIVDLDAPLSYSIDSADPAMQKGAHTWVLTILQPDETRAFSVTGRITTAQEAQERLTAKIFLAVGAQHILQTETFSVITVQSSATVADVIAEPGSAGLTLASEAKYTGTSGVQFGYGPNPPEVGKQTVYRIFWAVNVPSTTTGTATVTATLPAGATWMGNGTVTAGTEVAYDAKSQTLTWTIGALPQGQQTLMASFELSITPKAKDKNTTIQMLNPSTLTITHADHTTDVRSAAAVISPQVH